MVVAIKPFLGPMPHTVMVRTKPLYFYPDVLTSHLEKSFQGNEMMIEHIRAIDDAIIDSKTRITVQERLVDNPLLQSMAIRNIPRIWENTEDDTEDHVLSKAALFPLDIVSALKTLLVINIGEYNKLQGRFNAIEEFLVDRIVNVCALPQGSGDWCSFISLRRDAWDHNDCDWGYICGRGAQSSENISDVAGDDTFARIIEVLLCKFGHVAFEAFFRLQATKYHFYRVVLPCQRC